MMSGMVEAGKHLEEIMKWYGKPKAGREDFVEYVFPGTIHSGYVIATGMRFMSVAIDFELENVEKW